MKKILLVKITSMGDLIQMLPALTDAARAIPGIQFDWLAEESFKEVPRLHASVNQIITLPYRHWKKNISDRKTWNEIKTFWKTLRSQEYDLVIDAQSNLKSALVTSLAKGKKCGLDKSAVAEYGAQFAYHKKITIDRMQNHTYRMRQLMASFLDYKIDNMPLDYGINQALLPQLDFDLPEKFVFVTHITSRKEKLWPEPFWEAVIQDILQSGYDVVLPWWSDEEKARMLRLKKNDARIHAIPPLNLIQKASVLSKAKAAISLDTGLAHLAAALNIPNISIYGPTSALLTGAVGSNQIHLTASGPACAPCLKSTCTYQGPSTYKPACMETVTPKHVLHALQQLFKQIALARVS